MCDNILIVFVYIQYFFQKTPKLNVFMSVICECQTFYPRI